ncbi:hypothetical protein ACFLSZ_06085, partial [Candidatus Bipolaricaulota bacterium]
QQKHLPAIAARSDMIQRALKLNPQTGNELRSSSQASERTGRSRPFMQSPEHPSMTDVKEQDLTP